MVAAVKVSDNLMCFFAEQNISSNRKMLHIIHNENSIRNSKNKRQHIGNLDYSSHAVYRAHSRRVTTQEIDDTLEHPLYVSSVKYDYQGRPAQKIIGRTATVVLNPDTNLVVTTYHTNQKMLHKLMKQFGEVNDQNVSPWQSVNRTVHNGR